MGVDATQVCSLLDAELVTFIHNIIVLIKIAVPIILVVLGMFDFAKGVIASKEDEIKKGQQVFIKRLIAAACVFFVVTFVQLFMGFISKEDNSFWECADQILNGNVNQVRYSNSGDTSRCGSSIKGINEEYDYCLSVSGNQVCNSVFQVNCKVAASTKLWEYDNGRDINSALSGYSCKSGSGNHDNFYRRALYSCAKDPNNNKSLDDCVNLLTPFCSKNN